MPTCKKLRGKFPLCIFVCPLCDLSTKSSLFELRAQFNPCDYSPRLFSVILNSQNRTKYSEKSDTGDFAGPLIRSCAECVRVSGLTKGGLCPKKALPRSFAVFVKLLYFKMIELMHNDVGSTGVVVTLKSKIAASSAISASSGGNSKGTASRAI